MAQDSACKIPVQQTVTGSFGVQCSQVGALLILDMTKVQIIKWCMKQSSLQFSRM